MSHVKSDRKHAVVMVEVGPWREEIDEAIAPLIREMWIAGIETYMSCQEDGWGKVWISFPALFEMVKFLNIVARFERGAETLYNRMNYQDRVQDPDLLWDYELDVEDAALNPDEPTPGSPPHLGRPAFYFMTSVRFPPGDLPTVWTRMKEHNRKTVSPMAKKAKGTQARSPK